MEKLMYKKRRGLSRWMLVAYLAFFMTTIIPAQPLLAAKASKSTSSSKTKPKNDSGNKNKDKSNNKSSSYSSKSSSTSQTAKKYSPTKTAAPKKVSSVINKVVKPVTNKTSNTVVKKINNAIKNNKVVNTISKVVTKTKNTTAKAVSKLGNVKVANTIKKIQPGKVMANATGLVKKVTTNVNKVVKSSKTQVSNFAKKQQTVINNHVEKVKGFASKTTSGAKNVVNKIVSTGKNVVNKTVSTGKHVINKAVGIGKNVVKKVVGTGKNVVKKVVSVGNKAVSTGKNVINKAVNTGKNIINKVVSIGKNVVKKVVSTGKNVVNKVVSTGKNVVNKVVNTGKSVVNKVVNTGKNVVNKAVNTAKSIGKKVASIPSKVASAAKWVGNTIVSGIKSGVQIVKNKIHGIIDKLTKPRYDLYDGSNPESGPTVMEAAGMAQDTYKLESKIELSGGWKKIQDHNDGSLRMAVYERVKDDKTVEYVIANAGTEMSSEAEPKEKIWDWINNFQQPLGASEDMKNSLEFAREFVNEHPDSVLTFVGHSKGGAEASGNGLATGKNVMIFNPASIAIEAYGLDKSKYKGEMTAYIVKGEMLNTISDPLSKPIGKAVYLPQSHNTNTRNPINNFKNLLNNHSMDSVKEGIRMCGEEGK